MSGYGAWPAAGPPHRHMAALGTKHCGPAGHLAPEDRPDAIGAAVTSWAARHSL